MSVPGRTRARPAQRAGTHPRALQGHEHRSERVEKVTPAVDYTSGWESWRMNVWRPKMAGNQRAGRCWKTRISFVSNTATGSWQRETG